MLVRSLLTFALALGAAASPMPARDADAGDAHLAQKREVLMARASERSPDVYNARVRGRQAQRRNLNPRGGSTPAQSSTPVGPHGQNCVDPYNPATWLPVGALCAGPNYSYYSSTGFFLTCCQEFTTCTFVPLTQKYQCTPF